MKNLHAKVKEVAVFVTKGAVVDGTYSVRAELERLPKPPPVEGDVEVSSTLHIVIKYAGLSRCIHCLASSHKSVKGRCDKGVSNQNHHLLAKGQIIFCSACGAYTSDTQVLLLRRPCPGCPDSTHCKRALRQLVLGRHPISKKVLAGNVNSWPPNSFSRKVDRSVLAFEKASELVVEDQIYSDTEFEEEVVVANVREQVLMLADRQSAPVRSDSSEHDEPGIGPPTPILSGNESEGSD